MRRISYLGTPRRGSGVTDEFLTTPELLVGAGDTILLGCPWWYPLPAGLCLFITIAERTNFCSTRTRHIKCRTNTLPDCWTWLRCNQWCSMLVLRKWSCSWRRRIRRQAIFHGRRMVTRTWMGHICVVHSWFPTHSRNGGRCSWWDFRVWNIRMRWIDCWMYVVHYNLRAK